MNKAEQLIACLEGEIAKRDEELAACATAVENCELLRARIAELEDDLKCAHSMLAEVSKAGMALRAELSTLKAQEPVAWAGAIEYGVPLLMVEPQNWKATPLYASPAAPAADGWIPVSERLPAVESRLDQECRAGTLSIAPLNVSAAVLVFDGEKVRSKRLDWFDGCLPLPYCITHWMPLPAAPAANSAKVVV